MNRITVEHTPDQKRLHELEVKTWPIWTKEISEFPWTYDTKEICYFLEGKASIEPEKGKPVIVSSGDLVTFSPGLVCTWKILSPVRKHYKFE